MKSYGPDEVHLGKLITDVLVSPPPQLLLVGPLPAGRPLAISRVQLVHHLHARYNLTEGGLRHGGERTTGRPLNDTNSGSMLHSP